MKCVFTEEVIISQELLWLMVKAIIKEIEELKPKAIHIGYCDENKVAQQFYQKLGFKEYGRFDWGDIAASIVY
ncbi:GNAT family N-acetyltransferase [Vibrio mediterranei]|uniref:GNAT family N-acetyltransferase n=1 Tax=Vibrio mediterranei TaxID=689 RepID=UPI0018D58A24|nr:GNAT family N-acetyltransferase [Vibrio mediterranei]